jgi:SAM-dependent methyltransferase
MSFKTETAERFNGRVEDYERYRPGYPRELLSLLQARCCLRDSHVVADVGAGTGMLAKLFLENGNPVFAIEPNAEMRGACERLKERHPGLTILNGTSEATMLEDASVDFVSVGRAFHWFDQKRALTEFRRVLRPDGWVVIVTHRRGRRESAQEKDYDDILVGHGTDYQRVLDGYLAYESVPSFFAGGTVFREQLHGEQLLSLNQLIGQTQSLSVAPMPGHPKYDGMQRALREHFDRYAKDGLLHVATTSFVTCGQFASTR